jgi:hypothetical protein
MSQTFSDSLLHSSAFRMAQVQANPQQAPSLGPLAAFTGTFMGSGLNTIFRPNLGSPTPLPVTPAQGPPFNDNILELNLTHETLTFSLPLGSIPNRGEEQPDAFLNGVPYLQQITDVTNPQNPVGIHFEPGLWISVPTTTDPAEGATVARMASIPHGTTINAQGSFFSIVGPPDIQPVSITPVLEPDPTTSVTFPSQTAANGATFRIPQDLTPFIAAGTITQAILDDPNTVLRDAIAKQTITSTTVITISTKPAAPLFGGGTDNVAFLLGDPAVAKPNAQATQMSAIFWIETVQHVITVPPYIPGQQPVTIPADPASPHGHVYLVDPPVPVLEPRQVTVYSTQIQYSQTVILNFNGLLWPHVSVATLVPASPVAIPAATWALP